MLVLDERSQVKQAIQQWVDIYGLDRTYGADKRGRRVGAELLALDQETATAEQVSDIIGNPMWVQKMKCAECGSETWDVVELGGALDQDSATVHICRDCLRCALNLLEGSRLSLSVAKNIPQ